MATMRYRWTRRGYVAIAVVTVFVASAIGFRGEKFSGEVVRVIDGDTVALQGTFGEIVLRIWGIDAPEMNQPYGLESKAFLAELCLGEKVNVQVADVDRYKRRVARVTLPDGRDIGNSMLEAGMAWWAAQYAAHDTEKRRLQGEARAAGRGLWKLKTATPPWLWRRRSL